MFCAQKPKHKMIFPVAALADAGWGYSVFRGEKSYNGVANIASASQYYEHRLWAGKDDCRHICAHINGVKTIIFMCQLAVMLLIESESEIWSRN